MELNLTIPNYIYQKKIYIWNTKINEKINYWNIYILNKIKIKKSVLIY
jgi:hypothetical protein